MSKGVAIPMQPQKPPRKRWAVFSGYAVYKTGHLLSWEDIFRYRSSAEAHRHKTTLCGIQARIAPVKIRVEEL